MNTNTAALTAAAARITAAQAAEWDAYLATTELPTAPAVGDYVYVGRAGRTAWLVLSVEGETLTLGTRPENHVRWSFERGARSRLTRTEQVANVRRIGTTADYETLVSWGLAKRALRDANVAVATVTYADGTTESFDTAEKAHAAVRFAVEEMGEEATITLH